MKIKCGIIHRILWETGVLEYRYNVLWEVENGSAFIFMISLTLKNHRNGTAIISVIIHKIAMQSKLNFKPPHAHSS